MPALLAPVRGHRMAKATLENAVWELDATLQGIALAKRLVEYPAEFPRMRDAQGHPPVAMVNLIAGRRIVPELLQDRFTAENVAAGLGPLLADGPERETQVAALAEVRDRLRGAGSTGETPIARLADAVLELLEAPTPG